MDIFIVKCNFQNFRRKFVNSLFDCKFDTEKLRYGAFWCKIDM